MFRADLHCHSTFSDGSDSPQQLVDRAVACGLSGLSITDHDTVEAYREAAPYAATKGIPLLSGVEFSSAFRDEPIHILGYVISLTSDAIAQLCQRHQRRRRERNQKILDKLHRLGFAVEIGSDGHSIGRPHIALALVQRGIVASVDEAFNRFLGEGKLAYVPGEIVSIEETIEAIHRARGCAILAHPQLIKKRSVLMQMFDFPFDGLEGYYARFPRNAVQPLIDLARRKGWMITGGSDYHGSFKPQAEMGSSWVDRETFYALYK